jgi:hypothetical protein
MRRDSAGDLARLPFAGGVNNKDFHDIVLFA